MGASGQLHVPADPLDNRLCELQSLPGCVSKENMNARNRIPVVQSVVIHLTKNS